MTIQELKYDPVTFHQYFRMYTRLFEGLVRQLAQTLQRERTNYQSFDVTSLTIQLHFDWSEVQRPLFDLQNSAQEQMNGSRHFMYLDLF